jgi:pimeloyl-ACP methyl ester carboxylesterase
MRFLLFICINLLCFSTLLGQKEWKLSTPEGELKGTLLLPKKKKRNIPVVLLIAGSGPTDRDGNQMGGKNNALKYLAEALQKNNIATLRVDKRGVAGSASAAIPVEDLRFEKLVEDTKGWIDLLAKEKRFNKIIVAGHSQGALVTLLSAIDNKKVGAYISIAGPGRSIDALIEEQMSRQPDAIKEAVQPILEKLRQGETVDEVPPMLASLFGKQIQPYMLSWMQYDPAKEIKKLAIPALIVQGTSDIQVKEIDAKILAEAYPSAQKTIITNMNHVLKEMESMDMVTQMKTYTNPDLPLHKEMGQTVIDFVQKL